MEQDLKFKNQEDYEAWLNNQDWYQSFYLDSGIEVTGKVKTYKRLKFLNQIKFQNKTVIDIGCNSGQYCFFAKKNAASRVVGIDLDEKRIQQAKILSANECLDVDFFNDSFEKASELGRFDIVFCFAVLTEVENIIGALKVLKQSINKEAYIEMGISKPFLHWSFSRSWLKKDSKLGRLDRLGEFVRHKHAGWVIYPTMEVIKDIFGSKFQIESLGMGLRYELIHIKKIRDD